MDLPIALDPKVKGFLTQVTRWATSDPNIEAVALVGSHARGEATPNSDVDLVLLCGNPDSLIINQEWISLFGTSGQIKKEDWGKVTSVRVRYAQGLEVEFGITSQGWGADPNDRGDVQVIRDGIVVFYEIESLLSERVRRIEESGTKENRSAG